MRDLVPQQKCRIDGSPQGGVLYVPGDGTDHELLAGGPPGVRGGGPGLKPVLPLSVLVGQRHDRVILKHKRSSLLGQQVQQSKVNLKAKRCESRNITNMIY
jgi:hypothetical protein